MATQITTHRQDAINRLITQYQGQPKFEGFIDALAEQIQILEDESINTNDLVLNINTAEGAQLDAIGVIVDVARNGLSDADYRVQIFIKIGKNTSQGGAEKLISIFTLTTNTAWVRYVNLGHGEVTLIGTDDLGTREAINTLIESLEEVIAGGARIASIICADEFDSFAYEDTNALVTGLGYSNDTGTNNGLYAEIYRIEKPFAYAEDTFVDTLTEGYGAGFEDPIIGGVYDT